MTNVDLAERSRVSELMDAEDVDPGELQHAMDHLVVINRLLNGYGPTLAGLAKILPAECKAFSLLDVGCGSGDTLREVAIWARKRGIECRLTGLELSDLTADMARERCRDYPEIQIRHKDLFDCNAEEPYDVVHCALVLHHFVRDEDATRALGKMLEIARYGVLVNDLHRHWFAYYAIQVLTRAASRSHILRNDAPLSVARAFRREELLKLGRDAGGQQVDLHWHWAFRWLMILRSRSLGDNG